MNNLDFDSFEMNDNFDGFALPTKWHDVLGKVFPDAWFDGMRDNFGDTLSNDMIMESVHQASVFFNMDDPMAVQEDYAIGVYNQLPFTPMDDIVVFNREQFEMMGITEKDGLDLVMTHEGAHRALQGLDHGFNDHQEELCCDFMAGVRAGLNDMDFSQMESSLIDTPASESHPCGYDRVIAINKGVEYAQAYMDDHGCPPSFNDCLDEFRTEYQLDSSELSQVNLRQDEPIGVMHGYTQSEINSHISKAEHEMRCQESNMRHRESMMESKARMGEPYESEEYQFNVAKRKWEEAKAEYNRWKHTKPDIKGFVNDADWHIKEAQRALDRGDLGSYNDHMSSAEICSR